MSESLELNNRAKLSLYPLIPNFACISGTPLMHVFNAFFFFFFFFKDKWDTRGQPTPGALWPWQILYSAGNLPRQQSHTLWEVGRQLVWEQVDYKRSQLDKWLPLPCSSQVAPQDRSSFLSDGLLWWWESEYHRRWQTWYWVTAGGWGGGSS